jgi:hypothetical protein
MLSSGAVQFTVTGARVGSASVAGSVKSVSLYPPIARTVR